jgi:regulator of cell morphogenesis and NO signaling
MYQTNKNYITGKTKVADLLSENPSLLLMLELFELDFIVHEKTVAQLCGDKNISAEVFISFANLYNGFNPSGIENFSKEDISSIILYLRNTHYYYENEKYPEIHNYIDRLYLFNDIPEIKLIEKFFDEYFEEVKEHFAYENKVVFPYFAQLLGGSTFDENGKKKSTFSVNEYKEHHTDIETKLNDLKELLLKHIPVKNDRALRRKIIVGLFELEFDLGIHSKIEDNILIPLISELEKESC